MLGVVMVGVDSGCTRSLPSSDRSVAVSSSGPSAVARLSVGAAFLAAGLVAVLGVAGVLDLPGDPVELAAPLFAAGCAGAASLYLHAGERRQALAAAACAVGVFLAFAGDPVLSVAGIALFLLGGGTLLVGGLWDRRSPQRP